MKNIVDVLRQKELELQQVQGEVEALHVAMRLLSDEGDNHSRSPVPAGVTSDSRMKEISTSSIGKRQFP